MSIQGLLVVKPTNPPVIGAVKTYIKNGNRIKFAPPDKGGQPYRIMSATPDLTYQDGYGNLGFNVELDADPTAQPTPSQPRHDARGSVPANNWDERSGRIERQHSQEMALRYCELKGLKELSNEQFVALISWFQRDIGRPPLADQAKEIFNATELEPDEIPFE